MIKLFAEETAVGDRKIAGDGRRNAKKNQNFMGPTITTNQADRAGVNGERRKRAARANKGRKGNPRV